MPLPLGLSSNDQLLDQLRSAGVLDVSPENLRDGSTSASPPTTIQRDFLPPATSATPTPTPLPLPSTSPSSGKDIDRDFQQSMQQELSGFKGGGKSAPVPVNPRVRAELDAAKATFDRLSDPWRVREGSSIENIPNPTRKDFQSRDRLEVNEGTAGLVGLIAHGLLGDGASIPWITHSTDGAKYLEAKVNRIMSIGYAQGMSDGQVSQLRTGLMSDLGLLDSSLKGDAALDAADQVFAEYESSLVQNGPVTASTTPASDPTSTSTSTSTASPLSRYGVYTPDEIADIQSAIGQYVQGIQTNVKGDPRLNAAYALQAQMTPAVYALEGQQALAQQLYAAQDQLRYYQLMQQMPTEDASTSTSDADFAAAVEAALGKG